MKLIVKYTKNRYSPHRVPTPASAESAHTLKQSILLNKQKAVFLILIRQRPSRHQQKIFPCLVFFIITVLFKIKTHEEVKKKQWKQKFFLYNFLLHDGRIRIRTFD
jgi:hypothetical protein